MGVKKDTAKKSAYSLIEVLFVVMALGVLAAVAIPRLRTEFGAKMKVKTEAERLVSDLRLTRTLAVTNNANYRLSVTSSSKQYAIYDSTNTQYGDTRIIEPVITISGDKNFTFEPLGNASASSDTGVSLSAGAFQADVIVVVATGMISVSGP